MWLALLFLSLSSTSSNAYDLTLAWDANDPADEVLHYTLYWGAESGVYPNSASIGRLQYTVTGLEETQVYFFAVTASNRYGESGYSEELQYPNFLGAKNLRVTSIGSESEAIARTGTIQQINTHGSSGSQNINVPSDATLAIVCLSGYYNDENRFSDNPPSLGGEVLSIGAYADDSIEYFQGIIYYLSKPTTGESVEVAWDWGVVPVDDPILIVVFYKNVYLSGFRDSFAAQGLPPPSTDSLNAQPGDLIIVWAEQYTEPNNEITCSWINANEVFDAMCYVTSEGSFAEKEATGAVVITPEFSVPSDGGILALVLKPER